MPRTRTPEQERQRIGHREYMREYSRRAREDAKLGRAIREAVAASDKDAALAIIAEALRSVTGE
jgi:hypothetical protein